MEKFKRALLHLSICIGSLCVLWTGYIFATEKIKEIAATPIGVTTDDYSWVYQLDGLESHAKKIVLYGFAFQVDKNSLEGQYKIVLRDMESGKDIFPEMRYVERADVNEYFLCEYDYLKSGFEAEFKTKKLDLQNGNYQLLLYLEEKEYAFGTKIYISKGNIMYTNPVDYLPLEVEGTDLEEVVENGILRVYRPDERIYIYQYNKELYWIAEQEYFDGNEDTLIECQLDTTQVERLPKHRLENEWFWDNIAFWFSEYELTGIDTGKYRVAKKKLPMEYSIVRMWTGKYDRDWKWISMFRPYYEFE